MTPTPQTDLVAELTKIFPEFQSEWDWAKESFLGSESPHAVFLSFLPFVSRLSPLPRQLKALAAVLNGAVAAGGDAENAVATCFFEGLGRGPLLRALRPLLTAETKKRLHP